MNGGYDDGYRNCSCFWGVDPGSFVKLLTQRLHLIGVNYIDRNDNYIDRRSWG
jgi:hypothetical protein